MPKYIYEERALRRAPRYLYEDDNQGQQTQQSQQSQQKQQSQSTVTQSTASKQVEALKAQYMQVQLQIQQKTKLYQTDVANLKNKMLQIANQIAKLGGDAIDTKQAIGESDNAKYSLSKKLYESLLSSKADELSAAIIATFDSLPDISFSMDSKAARTFARRLLSWINEQNWNDGMDHSEDLAERTRMYLSGNSVSMSRKEINDFNDAFMTVLKDNTVFNWIFGRKSNRYNTRGRN